MAVTLVLDTNALNQRGLAHFLRHYHGRSVLPSVAAAELYVHLQAARRWDRAQFMGYLQGLRVTVEPLDGKKALLAVEAAGAAFSRDPLDAFIAAHALADGRVLVTNNIQDFPSVRKKVTPAALLRE